MKSNVVTFILYQLLFENGGRRSCFFSFHLRVHNNVPESLEAFNV